MQYLINHIREIIRTKQARVMSRKQPLLLLARDSELETSKDQLYIYFGRSWILLCVINYLFIHKY